MVFWDSLKQVFERGCPKMDLPKPTQNKALLEGLNAWFHGLLAMPWMDFWKCF